MGIESPSFDPSKVGDFRLKLSGAFDVGMISREIMENYVKLFGGIDNLKDEILAMAENDMADVALSAADAIGLTTIAQQCANDVRNHQGYGMEGGRKTRIEELLKRYPKQDK